MANGPRHVGRFITIFRDLNRPGSGAAVHEPVPRALLGNRNGMIGGLMAGRRG